MLGGAAGDRRAGMTESAHFSAPGGRLLYRFASLKWQRG